MAVLDRYKRELIYQTLIVHVVTRNKKFRHFANLLLYEQFEQTDLAKKNKVIGAFDY
jgi:hypothetical protein